MRKPRTYDSPEDAVRQFSASYRKAFWKDADARVEIWLEKDALAGVVVDVTAEHDVPLMVTPSALRMIRAADQATCYPKCYPERPDPVNILYLLVFRRSVGGPRNRKTRPLSAAGSRNSGAIPGTPK